MPLISVLLPVRDGAATVGAAISSTLAALPRDGELIVLDDGSQDGTQSIVERFADRRVRFMRNPEPLGVAASRQLLLQATDSEYIASMDADDISLPGRFSRSLNYLGQGADLAFSPVIQFRSKPMRVRPGLPAPISAEAMPLHLLVHNLLSNPTLVGRRDAVEKAGGYRLVIAEDYDLWLRALAVRNRLIRTPLPAIAYRHHDKQLSLNQAYVARAHADPALRDSYKRFVESRFGVEPSWLDALWSRGRAEAGDVGNLQELMRVIQLGARTLPPTQRWVLARTTRLLDAKL